MQETGYKEPQKTWYRASCIMHLKKNSGFTILELLIVISLTALILGLAAVFFANTLPTSRFNATVREMSATIKHAKSLAKINGESQNIIINLDSKEYGIGGLLKKNIPTGINIKVIDPFSGEIHHGKYLIAFNATGGIQGGTIVLWNNKRLATIQIDPVVGSVVIK